jgi:hypothetical protein
MWTKNKLIYFNVDKVTLIGYLVYVMNNVTIPTSRHKITQVLAYIDDVWAYNNPEMCDMDNPTGDIYHRRCLIVATTEGGRRFILQDFNKDPEDIDKAESFAKRILAVGSIDLARWNETYEVYGSSDWQFADQQRQFAHESNPHTKGTVRDY